MVMIKLTSLNELGDLVLLKDLKKNKKFFIIIREDEPLVLSFIVKPFVLKRINVWDLEFSINRTLRNLGAELNKDYTLEVLNNE